MDHRPTPGRPGPREATRPAAWRRLAPRYPGAARREGPTARPRAGLPRLATTLLALTALGSGCSDSGTDPLATLPGDDGSTWSLIQSEILDPHCSSCHSAGTSYALQSGLVLTADVAYGQLVGIAPTNDAARADGLLRVSADGPGSFQKSYLFEKINWPNEEHYLADHQGYGSLMPLGGPPLSYGQIRLVLEWLEAGAARTGVVADHDVLRDERVYVPGPFEGLDPPGAGEGFQLVLGPFEVAPGTEREIFRYEPLGLAQDIFVERVEISMRQGSHHFILYTFEPDTPASIFPEAGVIRDLYHADGSFQAATLWPMLHHQFFSGTQTPRASNRFPPGIALRLPAGEGFDLNAHYVNNGPEPTTGEVQVNVHTVPREAVEHIAQVLNLNNQDISLPPGQVTTLKRTFNWTGTEWRPGGLPDGDGVARIFSLVSHAHQHMLEFRVLRHGGPAAGEVVYGAYDWEHPPTTGFDPPLSLSPGEGLTLVATYDNWTDQTLRFGLLSEQEMMILFGSYYVE